MNPKLFLSIAIISLTSSQCLAMGESPDEIFLRAIKEDNINLAILALQNGANVNSKDSVGYTPLHYAVESFAPDIFKIEFLLNQGADINIKNNYNLTPLEIARTMNRGRFRQTPSEIEIYMKRETIKKLLEDWKDKTRKRVQEGTSPYIIPDLRDIVADYVVGPTKKDIDKKEKSE